MTATVAVDPARRPSPLVIWIGASRPKTLWAAFAPVAIAAAMARSADRFDAVLTLLCLAGAVSVQIGTNFVNDYCDFRKGADTEKRTGPVRACAAGWVRPEQMRNAAIAAFAVTLAVGIALSNSAGWPLLAVTIVGILSGIAYTAGPFPLGYNGLGDLFAFVFFGPVAVVATWYVQAGAPTTAVWIAGLAPGALSVAMISVNNLRDADEDRENGKRTLAVLFGKTFARLEYLAAVSLAAVVPVILVARSKSHAFALSAAIIWIPGLHAFRILCKTGGAPLNRVLAVTGILMLLYATLFSIGWMIG